MAEKIVEMLSSHSELGELRRRCDVYKEKDENWKRKIKALQKMCQDLVKCSSNTPLACSLNDDILYNVLLC